MRLPDSVTLILEIGPGRGYFRSIVPLLGYSIYTLDRNPDNGADFTGDISDFNPAISYDAVFAFEVLEHMPYRRSIEFFAEMIRLSSKHVIISLPIRQHQILGKRWEWPRRPDIPPIDREDHWDPHHWELGRKSYPANRVINDLESCGTNLVRRFTNPHHSYHEYLVFERV